MNKNAAQFEMGQKMSNDIMQGVQTAVQQHKQKQVNEATAQWMTLQAAHERLSMLGKVGKDGTVDLMQDPIAAAILTDPKKMKNMAKAFNVDFLNPEKTNVYAQGLQKAMKLDKAGKMTKMLRDLKLKAQVKPQGVDQQQVGSEIGKKVEGMSGPQHLDISQANELARTANTERDKWDFKQGVDPKSGKPTWYAFDKTNPNAPAKPVEVDGQNIGSIRPGAASTGKVLTIEGKPYGVVGQSGVITPSSPEFQNDSNAQVAYADANKAWALAEAAKQKLAGIRAQTYMQSREYGVIDTRTGQMAMVGPNVINSAPPGTYAPASGGMAAMSKEAVFTDLYWNADNVEKAAHALKGGFDATTRAEFIIAMRSQDPKNAFATFLSSEAGQRIAKDQDKVDYLTAVASLAENALTLRSVAGMGAGSDTLREAITRTVPGVSTASINTLDRQIELFRGTAQRLQTGVPTVMQPPKTAKDGTLTIDMNQ